MEKILVSTAYFPPISYFSLFTAADEIIIEREENYLKQTYRNRCYILSANGPLMLSVPVFHGNFHKDPIKEVRVDHSKRWQQIHLRAIISSYRSSPYFDFYFDNIERILKKKHEFLFDVNAELIESIMEMLDLQKKINYSTEFSTLKDEPFDFRYKINPKKDLFYKSNAYLQVFNTGKGFIPNLSIIDLIFNMGPESERILYENTGNDLN